MVILQLIRTQVLMRTLAPPLSRGKHRKIASLVRFFIEVIHMPWDFGEVAGSMMKLCVTLHSHKNLSGLYVAHTVTFTISFTTPR